MYEAHDALLCIAEGTHVAEQDRRRLTTDHRFRSAAEMRALFADLPEALDNTLVVAGRCAFMPEPRQPILPRFETVRGGKRGGSVDRRRGSGAPGASRDLRPPRGCNRRAAGGSSKALPRTSGLRTRNDRRDGFSRLLPDRRRFHPVGQKAGNSGRPGARLGRGVRGRLGAHHHRPRPVALRDCCSNAS